MFRGRILAMQTAVEEQMQRCQIDDDDTHTSVMPPNAMDYTVTVTTDESTGLVLPEIVQHAHTSSPYMSRRSSRVQSEAPSRTHSQSQSRVQSPHLSRSGSHHTLLPTLGSNGGHHAHLQPNSAMHSGGDSLNTPHATSILTAATTAMAEAGADADADAAMEALQRPKRVFVSKHTLKRRPGELVTTAAYGGASLGSYDDESADVQAKPNDGFRIEREEAEEAARALDEQAGVDSASVTDNGGAFVYYPRRPQHYCKLNRPAVRITRTTNDFRGTSTKGTDVEVSMMVRHVRRQELIEQAQGVNIRHDPNEKPLDDDALDRKFDHVIWGGKTGTTQNTVAMVGKSRTVGKKDKGKTAKSRWKKLRFMVRLSGLHKKKNGKRGNGVCVCVCVCVCVYVCVCVCVCVCVLNS